MPTMKKRQILNALTLTIILFSAIWLFNIQTSHASNTLTVPQDYPTIAAAVNHASPGDVIAVKQGIYYENIQINKSLSLLGENSENTIIIGNGGSNAPAVLTLAAAGIKVSGFTIESDDNSIPTLNAWGINIQGDNCKITGNIIKSNYIGIFCALQSSTTITDNTITLSIKDGIRFYSGTLNNISNNRIVENKVSGIALGGYANIVSGNNLQSNFRGLGLGASNSIVFDNTIVSNVESGIFLSGSKNVISGNEISANKYGIYITTQGAAPRANEIYQNSFVNNLNNAYGNSSFLVEKWDNGSSGNYRSDYQSTPYTINSNNMDNYPLTASFETSNPGKTPLAISPAPATLNGVVASWTFDNITSEGVIPDSTCHNPAVLA